MIKTTNEEFMLLNDAYITMYLQYEYQYQGGMQHHNFMSWIVKLSYLYLKADFVV